MSILWPNLATFGRSSHSPAHFAHSIDGAAQIRSGPDRRRRRTSENHAWAQTLPRGRPSARPSVRPYHPFRSHRLREKERPSVRPNSEMTKVEQPVDSTQYSTLPFIPKWDRPTATAGTSDTRACMTARGRKEGRKADTSPSWGENGQTARSKSGWKSYHHRGGGRLLITFRLRPSPGVEGRRRFSSCRFRIG